VEEAFIGEGYFSDFLQMPEHKVLRFSIRGIYLLTIFFLGYVGLSSFSLKWIKQLWLFWYGYAFLAVAMRIFIGLLIPDYLTINVWEFLNASYILNLTPFPYIFLLALNFLYITYNTKRNQ
jgi:hypothetical protein